MSRFFSAPSQTLAVALFAVTGLAAGAPMASMVDCSDSFWAVACEANVIPADSLVGDAVVDGDGVEPGGVVLERIVRIDDDPTCVSVDGGFVVCHT